MAIYWLFCEISPRSMATNVNTKSARYQQPFFHCSTIGDFTVAPTLGAQACVRQACTNRSASNRIGLRHPTCRACAQQVCTNMVARKTKLIYTADNHPMLLPALTVPARCEPVCKEANPRKQFSKACVGQACASDFGPARKACTITYRHALEARAMNE